MTNNIFYRPAAFINAIAEEGTKEEAVKWLQQTWNEMLFYKERSEVFANLFEEAIHPDCTNKYDLIARYQNEQHEVDCI